MAKILLVDDDADYLEVLKLSLEAAEFVIIVAHSGFEALKIIKEQGKAIDCVLADYQMPEMRGDELASLIKHSSDVPVIIMTGNVNIPIASVMKCGISGIINKPFDSKQLVEFLEINNLQVSQRSRQRKFIRQKNRFASDITLSNGKQEVKAEIYNVSSGGFGLRLNAILQPFSTVQFVLNFEGKELKGFMHCRWSAKMDQDFIAGFEFDSTTKKSLSLTPLFAAFITIAEAA